MKTVNVPAGTATPLEIKLGKMPVGTCASIFDGKTLNGWLQGIKGNANTTGYFTVNTADAAIQITGKGRSHCYTVNQYLHYRVIFQVRQPSGGNHQPCVLFFGQNHAADADGAVQFQLPSTSGWDYRPGKNCNLTNSADPGINVVRNSAFKRPALNQWSKCELLVNTKKGRACAAVAQPVTAKATWAITFYDPSVKTYNASSFALQAHNGGLSDEYKDLCIEPNPVIDTFVTTQ
jgi:hypothetical protein